jgi:hypothetical protein
VKLRGCRVTAEGDLDVRGTLGLVKGAPVGFKQIRLRNRSGRGGNSERTGVAPGIDSSDIASSTRRCAAAGQMSMKIEGAAEHSAVMPESRACETFGTFVGI